MRAILRIWCLNDTSLTQMRIPFSAEVERKIICPRWWHSFTLASQASKRACLVLKPSREFLPSKSLIRALIMQACQQEGTRSVCELYWTARGTGEEAWWDSPRQTQDSAAHSDTGPAERWSYWAHIQGTPSTIFRIYHLFQNKSRQLHSINSISFPVVLSSCYCAFQPL